MKLAELKAIAFYVAGLAALVLATLLFTGRDDLVAYTPPHTPNLEPTPTRRPTRAPNPTPDPDACQPTPRVSAYAYEPGAPLTTTLTTKDLDSDRLLISGVVYAADCRTPLPGARIEVWQTNAAGKYDRSGEFILRGQMRTDLEGRYAFTTTMPGRYLTGAEPLPARIHYRVSFRDYEPLPTQLSFAGDPFIHRFLFIRPELVTPLTKRTGPVGPILVGKFDIVLAVPPPESSRLWIERRGIDNSLIYSR
jgi:catechol 1,2-dioxygenase